MNTNPLLPKSLFKFTIVLLSLNAFIKFSAAQPFSIVVNGPYDICGTNNTYLSVTPSGGISFRWFHYLAYPWGQPYTTGPIFYYPPTGPWMCEVTTSNGVYTTSPIPIRTDQPYITAPYGSSTDCNTSFVYLREEYSTVDGYAVYNTYQWKKDGNDISGATNYTYNATSSGSYTCVVSLACGTGTSNPIAVAINNPIPSNTSITANGATTFCNGGSVTLSVPSTSGWSYQWKKDANTISGATTYSYAATQTGTYTCVITNICNSVTTTGVAVVAQAAPTAVQATITAGGPTTFCKGSNVVLTVATSGLAYQWTRNTTTIAGATMQSYTASKTATYKCTVSNNCGSTTSNSISVTQNPNPTATISQAPCSGGAVLLTCTSNPGSGVTFQWKKGSTILNGATNPTFNAIQNGNYKCIVTITATGCSKTSPGSSVTITCRLNNVVLDNKVTVYPNPTSNYFNINIAQPDPESVIYIYDLTGRLVESHEVSSIEMKVGASLSNGVYFLKVAKNNQAQEVIKLVKDF